MSTCHRCHTDTDWTIMSMFNTDIICPVCKESEKKHPDYVRARQADENAIANGDYNFREVGYEKAQGI